MSYSNEIAREIILDHVTNPRNKNKPHENYSEYTLKNPSCGDIVTVYVEIENETVKDITYNVEGCSICSASTSLMSELLTKKTVKETNNIITNFNNMVTGLEYEESSLEDAVCLSGIKDVPTRIKCATLPFKAFKTAIGEEDGL